MTDLLGGGGEEGCFARFDNGREAPFRFRDCRSRGDIAEGGRGEGEMFGGEILIGQFVGVARELKTLA